MSMYTNFYHFNSQSVRRSMSIRTSESEAVSEPGASNGPVPSVPSPKVSLTAGDGPDCKFPPSLPSGRIAVSLVYTIH